MSVELESWARLPAEIGVLSSCDIVLRELVTKTYFSVVNIEERGRLIAIETSNPFYPELRLIRGGWRLFRVNCEKGLDPVYTNMSYLQSYVNPGCYELECSEVGECSVNDPEECYYPQSGLEDIYFENYPFTLSFLHMFTGASVGKDLFFGGFSRTIEAVMMKDGYRGKVVYLDDGTTLNAYSENEWRHSSRGLPIVTAEIFF